MVTIHRRPQGTLTPFVAGAGGPHQILGHSFAVLLMVAFYAVLLPPDLGIIDAKLAAVVHAVLAVL